MDRTIMEKIIVLAFDGLSWNVINEMISDNKLNNIKEIIKKGCSGPNSEDPPLISPKIWTSISTGKKVEKHGVMDFYAQKDDVRSEQIWDILSRQGYTVGIYRDLSALGLKEIDKFFIPSFYSFDIGAHPKKLSYIHELDLQVRIDREKRIGFSSMIKMFWNLLKTGLPIKKLLTVGEKSLLLGFKNEYKSVFHKKKKIEYIIHTAFFYKLIKKYNPDYSFYFDSSIDSLCHIYWNDYQKKLEFSKIIPEIYEKIDNYIGKINKFAEKNNITLLIISDHGFVGYNDVVPDKKLKYLLISEFLRELALEDDIWGVSLLNEAVFRIKSESNITYEQFKKTFQSVTYNQKPVFKIKELNQRIIVEIHDYVGEDETYLKIELSNGKIVELSSVIDLNHNETGLHSAENGVFIIKGNNIKEGVKVELIKPIDITPTILALLGASIPSEVDGKVLKEIFKSEPKVSFYDENKTDIKDKKGLSKKEEDLIKERLRSLGYL